MRFEYQLEPAWPKLAWEATCEAGADHVLVRHGPGVETRDEWFCEAAWDGAFERGGFDRTDIVVGSGGRLREQEVLFVSAGNTVDRLQSVATPTGHRVSNSLACLAAGGDVVLDPSYRRYYRDFRSIIDGLQRVKTRVHTLRGDLRLHYFDNLAWDGRALGLRHKPSPARDFGSFEAYERFLGETMAALSGNARDPARQMRFEGLGTISTGYDSPAVAVIASRAGAFQEIMTFVEARGGSSDDGTPIAARLGLRSHPVAREAYRQLDKPEVPFLASNAYGEESHFAGAEALLAGRILYTGFHGDKAWAKDASDVSPDIVRGDPTGLALSEYRLRAGFLHCPVPFWGVRQIADLQRLSNAPELRQWDVPGDYSRPICRRIVEQAGVDRELFGQKKNAASVTMFNPRDKFLSPRSLQDYLAWLARTRGAPSPNRRHLEHILKLVGRGVSLLPPRLVPPVLRNFIEAKSAQLFFYLFPWSVNRAADAYRTERAVTPEPASPAAGGADRAGSGGHGNR